MKLAFDFGRTNTDIVSYLDGKMKVFSHPSEEINEKFLTKLLLHAEIDFDQLNVIAVTGVKSSDLGDTFNTIQIDKVNEVEALEYVAKYIYFAP